jgi:16S rRNA (cytosine1402-N4)-methyltransferase
MREEICQYLDLRSGAHYFDATLGGGGYTRAILDRSGPNGRVWASDRDQVALSAAESWASNYGDRLRTFHCDFSSLRSEIEVPDGGFDGFVMDLGVSSPQVDTPERGFSFRFPDAPLDMRMDQTSPVTAADLVNGTSERELARVLWEFGDERNSRRIAARIVKRRAETPYVTCGELVDTVCSVNGRARHGRIHPATRTFQAVRIFLNQELDQIRDALEFALRSVRIGGRIVVVSFHSLEDRIVKHRFRSLSGLCTCPPNSPICECGRVKFLDILTKRPAIPTEEEVKANPRAGSAKLRAAQIVKHLDQEEN